MPARGREQHQEHKHLAKAEQSRGHSERATGEVEVVSISYAAEGKLPALETSIRARRFFHFQFRFFHSQSRHLAWALVSLFSFDASSG